MRDGGTDYSGTFSIPASGKYTAYSKDKLGNESSKVVNISSAYSDSAYLWDVDISAGKLKQSFSKTTYKYNINLGEDEDSVILTPIKECDGAVMTIGGQVQDYLKVDVANNKTKNVNVVVSYGGKNRTYTFTIKRAISTSAWIKSLTADSNGTPLEFEEPFDSYRQNYTLNLSESTKSVTITDKPVSDATRTSFSAKTFNLNYGQTRNVAILVRAQSGFGRYYYIKIIRAACSDSTLKSVILSSKNCTLTPDFSPDKLKYDIAMPSSCSSFTLSAQAAGYGAKISINGKSVKSKKITLAHGGSIEITIKVTAQDQTTTDYTFDITRE